MSDDAVPLAGGGSMEVFTFGDPESVTDRAGFSQYLEVWNNGEWYQPPIDMLGLARTRMMASFHASALDLKHKLLMKTFIPSRWIDRPTFARFALDFLLLGNGFLEEIPNLAGRPLRYRTAPAVYVRVGINDGEFFWVGNSPLKDNFRFETRVLHVMEPDLVQEIYGLPAWLGALQAGLLNEAATIFRRRYYKNGSHAGFILYLSDATVSNEDAEALRQALRDSKGPGNFRNLFLHAPNGKKDGLQLIPISEVAAKDEFLGIKNVTRDDLLAAHRTPPQLLGIIPTNNAGFGNPGDALAVYFFNEIEPIQQALMQINDETGLELLKFAPFVPPAGATARAPA